MRLCNHSCRWLKPLIAFSHFSSCIWASKSLRFIIPLGGNSQHPKAPTQLIRSDLSSRDTVHRLDDLFSMCSKFVSAWKMNSCRNDAPANLYRFLPCILYIWIHGIFNQQNIILTHLRLPWLTSIETTGIIIRQLHVPWHLDPAPLRDSVRLEMTQRWHHVDLRGSLGTTEMARIQLWNHRILKWRCEQCTLKSTLQQRFRLGH